MASRDVTRQIDALAELRREQSAADAAALDRAAAAVLLAVTRQEPMPEALKAAILESAATRQD